MVNEGIKNVFMRMEEENGNREEWEWYKELYDNNQFLDEKGLREDTIRFRDMDHFVLNETSKDLYPM